MLVGSDQKAVGNGVVAYVCVINAPPPFPPKQQVCVIHCTIRISETVNGGRLSDTDPREMSRYLMVNFKPSGEIPA